MSTVVAVVDESHHLLGRHERRLTRRRLARQDALSSRRAELHAMGDLLAHAVDVVGGGWVQNAWFSVGTASGARTVRAHELGLVETQPVIGACLVGAVVHGGGGPANVQSQLVQRTLDLIWQTLREETDAPVRWCPGPDVRRAQLRDLTRWNDASRRTQEQVVDLLVAARQETGVLLLAGRQR